jgi:hypothetical protein
MAASNAIPDAESIVSEVQIESLPDRGETVEEREPRSWR